MTEVQVLLEIMIEQILFKHALFVEVLTILQKKINRIRKYKGKYHTAGDSGKQRTEHTAHNLCRCRYVDHLIAKCLKPPKDNDKQQNQVRFN